MASRDDVARLATLAASLRKAIGEHPCKTPADARRWVSFAYECIEGEGMPSLLHAFAMNDLEEGFHLGKRWLEGEAVTAEELHESWRTCRGRAGTFSTDLKGEAAAHWAIVHALEAAMYAASTVAKPEVIPAVSVAAEASAKYARLAHGAASAFQATEHQKALLARIFTRGETGA